MAQGQASNSDSNHEGSYVLIIILLFAIYFAFNYFKEDLIGIWQQVRMVELFFFRYLDWLPYLNSMNIEAGYQWLAQTHPSQVTADLMSDFDNHYGKLRYLFIPIPAYLGMKLMSRFAMRNSQYDMDSLLARLSKVPQFAFLKEFVSRHPEKGTIFFNKKSRGAMANRDAVALLPSEFVTMVPPLGLKVKRPIYDGEFVDKELARKAFDAQLGGRWTGKPTCLSSHERKLFDELMKILIDTRFMYNDRISDPEKQRKAQTKKIMALLNKHAYIRTMFLSMLGFCKEGGVLPALKFRWIKAIDRTLWYCISSHGRKTPFIEAGGVVAHWELECALKSPNIYIETECAVEGLEYTLFGPPEEEEDPNYS